MFVITRVTKAAYKKALRTGSIDDVAAGLDAGIDVDLEIERGQTALHDSVQRGRAEVVRLLLNRNAKVNVCDSAKRTPLDIALGGGQSDIVDALRASGAKT